MKDRSNKEIQKELEQIRAKNGGMLRAEDVVAFARNKKTALHKKFCWDDTEAARLYRLEQARYIIRVVVIVNPKTKKKIRAYVSLRDDRNKEGGFRATVDVLSDEDLTDIMLEEAYEELKSFELKYSNLKECAEMKDLFVAIRKTLKNKKRSRKK